MLVVPPKSQVAKLQLSYRDWEIIQACLLHVSKRKITEKMKQRIELVEADVDEILGFLRQEGHV